MSINSIDNEILVTVNGIVMKKNEDYTIENGNLTFKIAPEINKNANKDPEFLGRPMVLTDVISNHPKRDNTKGIITAKTKPKIPIEAAFAKTHFFQLTSGNFL